MSKRISVWLLLSLALLLTVAAAASVSGCDPGAFPC